MAVKKKKIVTSSYSNVSYDTTELYRKNDDAGRAVRFCGTRQEVYMYTLVMCAKLFVRICQKETGARSITFVAFTHYR